MLCIATMYKPIATSVEPFRVGGAERSYDTRWSKVARNVFGLTAAWALVKVTNKTTQDRKILENKKVILSPLQCAWPIVLECLSLSLSVGILVCLVAGGDLFRRGYLADYWWYTYPTSPQCNTSLLGERITKSNASRAKGSLDCMEITDRVGQTPYFGGIFIY